jgi:Zn-dependent protease
MSIVSGHSTLLMDLSKNCHKFRFFFSVELNPFSYIHEARGLSFPSVIILSWPTHAVVDAARVEMA